mmetsp:Transcript_27146/g.68090  ORF Transcript_27146/g.68090 Transcript_27146/m.68090 type:complete len:287 (-) Transcript_27146:135-995(-)
MDLNLEDVLSDVDDLGLHLDDVVDGDGGLEGDAVHGEGDHGGGVCGEALGGVGCGLFHPLDDVAAEECLVVVEVARHALLADDDLGLRNGEVLALVGVAGGVLDLLGGEALGGLHLGFQHGVPLHEEFPSDIDHFRDVLVLVGFHEELRDGVLHGAHVVVHEDHGDERGGRADHAARGDVLLEALDFDDETAGSGGDDAARDLDEVHVADGHQEIDAVEGHGGDLAALCVGPRGAGRDDVHEVQDGAGRHHLPRQRGLADDLRQERLGRGRGGRRRRGGGGGGHES